MTKLIEHIEISNDIISNPKNNCVYHVKNKNCPNGEMTINFELLNCDSFRVIYFDLSTFTYKISMSNEIKTLFIAEAMGALILKESLPLSLQQDYAPMIYPDTAIPAIALITKIIIHQDPHLLEVKSINYVQTEKFELLNNTLKQQAQALAGEIKVKIGKYPIFKENWQPDDKFLKRIYKKFITYNDDTLLTHQCALSTGWCSARAHFVCAFLSNYNISAIKVSKTYDIDAWKKYKNSQLWGYHCCAMVIGNDKRWIFDPWVGNNHKLLTINEWLHRTNEPTPEKFILTNQLIRGNTYRSKKCTPFLSLGNDYTFMHAFQAVRASATPNPPEKPIKISNRLDYPRFFLACHRKEVLTATSVQENLIKYRNN